LEVVIMRGRVLAAVGIGALVAGIVVGGVAVAETGQADTIQACVKRNGTIRIVDSTDDCRRNWTPLEWNVSGLEGPVGPAGPQQVDVALREKSQRITIEPDGAPGGGSSSCAAGEAVVGGGLTSFDAASVNAPIRYVAAGPFFDGSGSGWSVQWFNDGDVPITINVSVSALCVKGAILNFPGTGG
jgi:hypothetical protein